jgi:hypothetical protein
MCATGLALILAAGVQDRPAPDEIRDQVRAVVDRAFLGAGAERRRDYAERIAASLYTGGSPERARRVLEGLAEAADYHGGVVAQAAQRRGGYSAPPELVQEGFDLQAEMLVRSCERALRTELTPSDRARVRGQVETLFETAGASLKEAYPGDAAGRYLDRELASLKRAWISKLDDPFHSNLSTPLSDADLETVKTEIRAQLAGRPSLTLEEKDFFDEERLETLGFWESFGKVRESVYGATRISHREFAPLVAREREWKSRVARMAKEHRALAAAKESEEDRRKAEDLIARLKEPRSPGTPAASSTATSKDSAPSVAGPIQADPAAPSARTRWAVPLVLLAVAIVGGLVVWKSRKTSPET